MYSAKKYTKFSSFSKSRKTKPLQVLETWKVFELFAECVNNVTFYKKYVTAVNPISGIFKQLITWSNQVNIKKG